MTNVKILNLIIVKSSLFAENAASVNIILNILIKNLFTS